MARKILLALAIWVAVAGLGIVGSGARPREHEVTREI
jgi:hypothetical protein